MAIQLASPSNIRIRHPGPRAASHRKRGVARAAIETILRSSLIGVGIGVSLVPGHGGQILGIAALGVLAIGAALASWEA